MENLYWANVNVYISTPSYYFSIFLLKILYGFFYIYYDIYPNTQGFL
jgi:hypothetical protein